MHFVGAFLPWAFCILWQSMQVPVWAVYPRHAVVGVRVILHQPVHSVDADARGAGQLVEVPLSLLQQESLVLRVAAIHDDGAAPGPDRIGVLENGALKLAVQEGVGVAPEV